MRSEAGLPLLRGESMAGKSINSGPFRVRVGDDNAGSFVAETGDTRPGTEHSKPSNPAFSFGSSPI